MIGWWNSAMDIMMEKQDDRLISIKVIGVGGGGGNAVNRMIESGVKGVDFVAINTDAQVLASSKAREKLTIGERLTKGRGAGGEPEQGQRSAEESREQIADILKGSQMVFITAGMGGGTGTGAAPIVAEIARGMDILTVGIVTRPFQWESKRRSSQAEIGIAALREHVDSLIVVPNDRLKYVSDEPITLKNAFLEADNILKRGVESISSLINVEGFINLDFADVTSVMKDAGYAHMGVSSASGKDKMTEAIKKAINSPLLETCIDGSTRVIVNVSVPTDIQLSEVETAGEIIEGLVGDQAHLIYGVAFDDSLEDEVRATVIGTGFDSAFMQNQKKKDASKENNKIGAYKNTNYNVLEDENNDVNDDFFKSISDIFNDKNR